MKSSSQKRFKKDSIFCSLCNRIITTNERYVKCDKCPFFFQCVQCFSIYREYEHNLDHNADHNLDHNSYNNLEHGLKHNFIIIEPRPSPIFCQNWMVNDELLLLSGIKLFGIGNWNDIADYMKNRTAGDIEHHYTSIYINSPYAPFPLPEVIPPLTRPNLPTWKAVDSCPSEAHEKNLQDKNKKEKNLPSEFNGYMPWRHEYEFDFYNDAENLVAKLEFKDDEEIQDFNSKIALLKTYNGILAERKFRTKVIEDSDIHHKVVKPSSKNDKELDQRYLGGVLPEERAADSTIISIAPYFGFKDTQLWANNIHQKLQFLKKIEQREQWFQYGVRSLSEGLLFSNLQNCIKEGKTPVISDIENWNELIAKYNRANEKSLTKTKDVLLSQESQLCSKEKICPQLYLALKCLLIREGAIRPLRKQDAIAMDANHPETLSKIYDLLVSLGILTV